ncbi:hypothetical protein BH10BAC1_BH10BAC1_08040 [soil metagenome]
MTILATILIIGKFKRTGETTCTCKGRNEVCGFHEKSVTATNFIFPDYFAGPFPKGTKPNSKGQLQVPVERIIELNDFCDDSVNELNAIILLKEK